MKKSSGTILDGERRPEGRGTWTVLRNPKIILVSLIFLVPGGVFAQDRPHGSDPDHGYHGSLEAELDAARGRLQQAAQEVAELTTQLNRSSIQHFSTMNGTFGRVIIGVQLDPSGGKDGAHVTEVSPGGPAAEAGIHVGDVIVVVNGTEVKGEDASRQVVNIIRDVKSDSKLNVRVLRNGKTQDFTITPRPGPGFMGPESAFPAVPAMPAMPAMPALPAPLFMSPLSNMELATLTPQLGRYFGTEKGVLVVRAPADGAFKLEDGDVILAIDGREPKSGSHAIRILGSYQPGEKVMLRIVRERKTMDLETTVPEEPAGPRGRPRRTIIFDDGSQTTGPVPRDVVIVYNKVETI